VPREALLQPDLLVVEDCASGVLDPKEEEELAKQTQIQDVKDASQAIDRLLRLKTEQKKVYGRKFGVHSAWRRRHLMVQSFLWLEAIREKVGGRRRERALQVARSYNRGTRIQCARPKCADCTAAENCKLCVKGTRCDSCRQDKVHTNNSCKPNRRCDGCIARKERCTCVKKKKCPRCQATPPAGKCEPCELLPPRCTSNCE
jgi:hypothetical protein